MYLNIPLCLSTSKEGNNTEHRESVPLSLPSRKEESGSERDKYSTSIEWIVTDQRNAQDPSARNARSRCTRVSYYFTVFVSREIAIPWNSTSGEYQNRILAATRTPSARCCCPATASIRASSEVGPGPEPGNRKFTGLSVPSFPSVGFTSYPYVTYQVSAPVSC